MKSHINLNFFGEFMQINSIRLFGMILFLIFLSSKSFSQGPNIVYTPLSNSCVEGPRTIIATITDADGVPTSGAGLPVLYFNFNNSVVYNAVTGVSIGNNQYQFTFGTGAVVGFVVGYYIVAQDNTGLVENCSVNPSAGASGFTVNPPAVTTVPTSPNFFVIQPTLTTGNYLIGAGQIFTSITDAVNAYNNSCLNGPVSFLLTDATYSSNESFPISINNPQASATNTLTIKPNTGVTTTITGNSADALFKLNGADYVIFDGSNAGNTVRSMTFQNTSVISTSVVFWLSSFNNTNGATYNTIKNCNIYASGPNTSFACVALSSGVIVSGASDAPNTNNSLINNDINNSFYAVYLNGAIGGESSNVISGNILGSSIATRKTGYRALFLANQNNINVSANRILGVNSTFYSGAEADATAAIVVSGSCTGGIISGNNIYDIRNNSNSGSAVYGISLQTTNTASGLKVYNNFIHSVAGYGKPGSVYENGMGIAIISGGGYGIYYNSIHLGSNQTVFGVTACLYIGVSASGANDVRNNIFSNRQTLGVRYAVYNSLSRNIFSSINYNDYFSNGYLGYLNDPIGNLAGWQAATLSDGNSVAVDPIFVLPNGTVTAIDLHLQNASTLNDQAVSIPGITIDYDGVTRSATTPDIGADEFTPPNCTTNFGGVASSISSNIVCLSGQAVLICSGFDFGAGMSYQWESSTDNFVTAGVPIVGETNPTTANPPIITVTTYFRLRVRCGSGGFGYSNSVLITVKNPQITATIPASRCGNGSLTLTANCNTGTTVQWYTESTGGAPIATGTTYTTPVINATQTFYAEPAFIGNSGTCGPATPQAVSNAISYQYTPWDVYFDVLQATTLASVDVYPNNPGDAFKIEIFNSNNTLVGSTSFVTSVSGGATAQLVPVNIFLLPGNDYYISIHTDDPIYPMATGLSRNVSGANYPYTSSDINITGNGYLPTFYMCLYNWKFNNGCTVSRVPVTATIGTPSEFNINGITSICSGNSTTLTASSTNSSYTYSWSPISTTGSSVTVSPTTNTRYTVTAFDGTCTNVKTIDVVVSEAPTPITINSNAGNPLCNGSAVTLTAVGGNIPSMVTIINEKFEGNGLPLGWDTSNINPQAAFTIAGKWTQRRSIYVYGSNGFKSNDSSKFFMANSSATGSSLLNTSLKTPRLDFTGYDSASLIFWHHYSPYLSPDSIIIEKSKSSTATEGTWKLGTVYKAGLFTSDGTAIGGSLGTTLNFVQKVINLKPFLTPTSSRDTFYLRFRYVGKGGYWWAIDNVKIEGRGGSPITWSPSTGLFDNAACTNAYNPLMYTSIVYTKPTAPVTYTAISGTPNGCSQSASITLTPRNAVSTSMSGNTTICPGGNANISIAFTGAAPWKFVIKNVTTGVSTALLTANTSPYVYNTGSLNANTVYKVFSMKDSNNLGCSPPASALLSDSVKITISSLKARITGITTICSGASANLSVTLTGTPPWRLQYLSGSTPVVLNGITSNPYTITVSPSTTTTYTLDSLRDNTGCTALRDSLLGSAVVTVIPSSTAVLSGGSTICPGTSATLSTTLSGTPPWNITYTNGVTPIIYTGVTSSPHVISVTPVSSPTTYSISALTDGNGCTTSSSSISGSAIVTTSPIVAGSLTGTSTICQSGTASLTATLTGTSPWKITYTQNGGSPVTINNITSSPYVFSVTPAVNTTYALTSVIDGNLCSASSSNLSSNAIVTINRVKAILSGTTAICPGTLANLTVSLTGTPPWRLQYLSGSTPVLINGITSNPYIFTVNPSVTTTYTLDSLRDNTGCAAKRDSLQGSAVVTIRPSSTAVTSGTSTICSGSSASISTVLTGTPPWNITYTNGVTLFNYTGITSSPHTITVTPISSPTTYSISTITDGNGCSTPTTSISGSAVITTNPTVSGSLTGTNTICEFGTTMLSVNLTGSPPWKFAYTENGTNTYVINNVTTSPYVFFVSPVVNTTYVLNSIIDGNGCTASPANLSSDAVITILTSTSTRWNGYSDDWFDINNWCGSFPDETTDVIIPSGTTFSPVIFGSEAFVRNLTINDGASLTVNTDGALSVAGNSEINGTLTNNGKFILNGSEDQLFPGGASSTGTILKMNELEINKLTGKVFFNRKFPITDTGVLKITNAFFISIGDTITFTSGISGTSRIDVIPENVIIDYRDNGCITVERFIPAGLTHGKSWQLLSVPTFGQTIKQAWQEGAASVNENPIPGYGTTITSNLPDATTTLGFDFYTPLGSSIKIFDDLQNNYTSVATTEELIANPKGYMLLVRGDRSVLSGTASATPVVLRTTGKIYYGTADDAPVSLPVQSDGFQCAGNPYPSPIDFQSVLTTSTNLNSVFYVWDPTLQGAYGLGGFQTISSLNDWKPIPGGTINYNADTSYSLIQSGQAFFTYSTSGGSINFAEVNKVSGQKTVMRNHNDYLRKTIRLHLFDVANKLVDGNVVVIDSNSLDGINEDDAVKLKNFGENAAVKNQNRLFSLEVRPSLAENDTIQYYLTNLRQQSYKISLLPNGLANADVTPFLIDSYTDTELQLSINDTSFYHFEITNNPASKNPERFKIVFKRLNVLPISFIEVSATLISGKGKVSWEISSESDMQKYQIEKSTDGISFVKIGTVNAMGNDGNLHQYSFIDSYPNAGNNFYRIRGVSNLGVNQLSNIVRIWVEQKKPAITVSPNPIENNSIDLTLHHFMSGNYLVQLYNSLGQFLLQEEIKHDGQLSFKYFIKPPKVIAKGNYLLKIISSDAHQITTKIIVK